MESSDNRYDKTIKELEDQLEVIGEYKKALEEVILFVRQDKVTNGKYSDVKASDYADVVNRVIKFGKKLNEINVHTIIAAEVKLNQLKNHIAMQKKFFRGNQ